VHIIKSDEELHKILLDDPIRENEMRAVCSMHGIVNSEGKGLLGRPRRRWKNNIKVDLTN
jgi:hypothetical protein